MANDLQQCDAVANSTLEQQLLERTRMLEAELGRQKQEGEALRRAREQAEACCLAKSSFFANVSHEVRTPLHAIIGYSERLYEEAGEPCHSDLRNDLANLLVSARHLLAVISDVLDLSRLEAGKASLQLEPVCVEQLIRDLLPIARGLTSRNRNVLDVVMDTPSTAMVEVDALRFRQCALNLLGNACAFTLDGTITLSTRLAAQDGRHWVVCSVRDTGMGIAQEHLPELFQSFSQANTSAARTFGGTGLGLCISQQLCHAMGGSIQVHSELGTGSDFQMWFPLAAAQAGPPARVTPQRKVALV